MWDREDCSWDDIVWFGKYSPGCPATGSWRREWTALSLATVVTQQTMKAGKQPKQRQDCRLLGFNWTSAYIFLWWNYVCIWSAMTGRAESTWGLLRRKHFVMLTSYPVHKLRRNVWGGKLLAIWLCPSLLSDGDISVFSGISFLIYFLVFIKSLSDQPTIGPWRAATSGALFSTMLSFLLPKNIRKAGVEPQLLTHKDIQMYGWPMIETELRTFWFINIPLKKLLTLRGICILY